MPRSRKDISRNAVRGGHGSRESSIGFGSLFRSFAGTENSLEFEARNTQHYKDSSTSDHKLRHAKINFVGSGDSFQSQIIEPDLTLAEMTLNESVKIINRDKNPLKLDAPLEEEKTSTNRKEPVNISHLEMEKPFIVNTLDNYPVSAGLVPTQILSTSPSPSDSSDEVILFHGRNNIGKALSKQVHSTGDNARLDISNSIIREPILERRNLVAVHTPIKDYSASNCSYHLSARMEISETPLYSLLPTLPLAYHSNISKPGGSGLTNTTKSKRSSQRNRLNQTRRDHQQALFDDYIQNTDSLESGPELWSRHNTGESDNDSRTKADLSFSDTFQNLVQTGCDKPELCDLESMSKSDGKIWPLRAILSKRKTRNDLQYLVIWGDGIMDKTCWVPSAILVDAKARALIKQFEAKENLVIAVSDEGYKDIDADLEDNPIKDEGFVPTNDYLGVRKQNLDILSDEQITRVFTEQENFDMRSDELKPHHNGQDVNIRSQNISTLEVSSVTQCCFQNGQKTQRSRGDFPAASALADAYAGFDILDFERPSLKKKPKGRKGKPAFDLSDSSLEDAMHVAWENDRSQKKQRKMKRQELRNQGLLGKSNNKPDLKLKYREGMSIHTAKNEIKTFLISGNASFALPPMVKADRKIVHEIANAFNLKSKSVGNGQSRFPVLYRTSYTPPYTESKFVSVEAKISRRYLPRTDIKGKGSLSMAKRESRGGGTNTAVSYRDGDIVGGSAPELGVENKGRAMLEKMGWSTGTALGALNNKGILEPVPHVVKTTKAGLG